MIRPFSASTVTVSVSDVGPAAYAPIVEEAGGAFAELWGARRIDTYTASFGAPADVAQLITAIREAEVVPSPTAGLDE